MLVSLHANGHTHTNKEANTHLYSHTNIHTHIRKDSEGYRWCALGLVTGALKELVLDPV